MIKTIHCRCDGTWEYSGGRAVAEVEGTWVRVKPFKFQSEDDDHNEVKALGGAQQWVDLSKPIELFEVLPTETARCRNCGSYLNISYEPGAGIRCVSVNGRK